jgi:transcriptional regulator with XRE-family HTH domain
MTVAKPYVDLAALLRERRRSSGLSVRALSNISGVAPSTVSRIENGRFTPTFETAVRLAQVLEIDLAELPRVGPKDEKSPTSIAAAEAHGPLSLFDAASPVAVRVQTLKPGFRRNLRKIACGRPYQFLLVLTGEAQIRARDGSRMALKPGVKLDCKLLRSDTYYAVAVQETELLWIG